MNANLQLVIEHPTVVVICKDLGTIQKDQPFTSCCLNPYTPKIIPMSSKCETICSSNYSSIPPRIESQRLIMRARLSSHWKIKCSIKITTSPRGSGHALHEATTPPFRFYALFPHHAHRLPPNTVNKSYHSNPPVNNKNIQCHLDLTQWQKSVI